METNGCQMPTLDGSSASKPGRKTKKTDKRVEILLGCLEDNMSIEKACDYAMIHKQTYYNWFNTDEDFSTRVLYAISLGIRRVTRLVEKEDPWKILKNKDPENFKEREGPSTVNMMFNNYAENLKQMGPDEILKEGRKLFGIDS